MVKDCPDNPKNEAKLGVRVIEPGPDDYFCVQEKRRRIPRNVRLTDFRSQPVVVENSSEAPAVGDGNSQVLMTTAAGRVTLAPAKAPTVRRGVQAEENGQGDQVSTESWGSAPTSRPAKHLTVKQIKAPLRREQDEAGNKTFFAKGAFGRQSASGSTRVPGRDSLSVCASSLARRSLELVDIVDNTNELVEGL